MIYLFLCIYYSDTNFCVSSDCDYDEDYHLEGGSESNLPQVTMENVDEAPISTSIVQRNGETLTTKFQNRNSQFQKWNKNSQDYKSDAATITTEPKVKGYIDVWWLYDDGGRFSANSFTFLRCISFFV